MSWPKEGAVVLHGILPEDLVDAYCELRAPLGPIGWSDGTPYMRYKEIRDLCLCAPVVAAVEAAVGERVGLHLNLTNWISSERTWHQDHYLNPPHVGDGYCGAWFALADIDPDSGPFEYVPGSHLWQPLERADVLSRLRLTEADPSWPWQAEPFVTEHWNREIAVHGVEPIQFIASKGDLLLWHPKLVHMGSRPKVPGMERRSLIAHYSAISKRRDMPRVKSHGSGEYFVL